MNTEQDRDGVVDNMGVDGVVWRWGTGWDRDGMGQGWTLVFGKTHMFSVSNTRVECSDTDTRVIGPTKRCAVSVQWLSH